MEKFFDEAVPYKKTSYKKKADNEYYTLREIMEKYNLGRKAVWNRCEKLGIPKVYEGRNTFWNKKAIDSKFADLIEEIDLPIIVDAGIGKPSQACEAMEMGAAAVMANTALATAGDLTRMATAFKKAIESGREAYLAGLGRVLVRGASASDPLTGFLRD